MEFAARALSARAQSMSELRTRLKRRAERSEDVEAVISRLKQAGVLNDGRFADALANGQRGKLLPLWAGPDPTAPGATIAHPAAVADPDGRGGATLVTTIASAIGGGLLAAAGLQKRSVGGLALAMIGGDLDRQIPI